MDYPSRLRLADQHRCTDQGDDGTRCQLVRGHTGRHAAMISWGDTTPLAFDGPLPWAAGFPRLE